MNSRKLLAGALGVSLLAGALPGVALAQADTSEITPEGVEWTLTTLAGEPVPEDVAVTLFLSGGEVVGNAGCNSYFGSYELADDALTFPNPFGVTQMFCEGPAMDVETAYLPALQSTATFAFTDEGALSLTDADGVEQLVYSEATVDVTMTDVEALVATLGDLQAQIDAASAEVAALSEAAASIDVNKLDKRIKAVESSVKELEKKTDGLNVSNLKKRISANEKAITELQKQVSNIDKSLSQLHNTDENLKKRLRTLEDTAEKHEARIEALEATPEQPLP